jgi:hypothetical protein
MLVEGKIMLLRKNLVLALLAIGMGLISLSLSPSSQAEAAPPTTLSLIIPGSTLCGPVTVTVFLTTPLAPIETTSVSFTVISGSGILNPSVVSIPGAVGTSSTGTSTFTASPGFVGQVTIRASALGGSLSQEQTLSVNCANSTNNNLLISTTATPNALRCGGTSLIRATAVNQTGAVIPDIAFVFSTTAGLLTSPTPNSVTLQLVAGAASATVTATTISITPANPADPNSVATSQIVTGNVVVQNYCGGEQYKALAVVASPNVVACGGSSVITATARDSAGHILHGVGYHFAVDVGKLDVGPPNSALAVDNTAVLTVLPGMKTTTVTVWTDGESSNPGKVIVQQYCKDTDAEGQGLTTTAPGNIQFTLSSPSVSCGRSIFVGTVVRDKNNQIVPDDTQVSFMTDSGSLSSYSGTPGSTNGASPRPSPSNNDDNGSSGSVTSSTSNAFQGTPVKGAMNFTFTADPFTTGGYATITAAAGASFGSTKVQVTCQTPAPALSRTTGNSSGPAPGAPAVPRPASCTPIGDNICIRPPSTGDAGLRGPRYSVWHAPYLAANQQPPPPLLSDRG